MANSRAAARKMQDEPEAPSTPESKEVLNKQKDGGHVKWAPETPERALNGQGGDNLINKINNVVLDYNLKYKTSMYESILI